MYTKTAKQNVFLYSIEQKSRNWALVSYSNKKWHKREKSERMCLLLNMLQWSNVGFCHRRRLLRFIHNCTNDAPFTGIGSSIIKAARLPLIVDSRAFAFIIETEKTNKFVQTLENLPLALCRRKFVNCSIGIEATTQIDFIRKHRLLSSEFPISIKHHFHAC